MSLITPIFGKPYPTATPLELGGLIAQLATGNMLEVTVRLGPSISGEVLVYVLGWDDDCGWQPLSMLTCNERAQPPLEGRNHFDGIAIPTQRYVCLYAPQLRAADIIEACVSPYDGAAVPYNTFWQPWTLVPPTPPAQPNPENQEFSGTALNSGWDFTEIWVPGGVNRGGGSYAAPPNQVHYSVGERPSWLFMQAASGIGPGFASMTRQYSSLTPDNWYMSALVSIDTNNWTITEGDSGFIFFMNNPLVGFIGISARTDADGFINFSVTSPGRPGGDSVAGSTYVCPEVMCNPVHLVVHKIANLYRCYIGTLGGQYTMICDGVDYATLNPTRYGFIVDNASVPNMVVGVDYVRHIEAQVVNQ